MVLYLKKKKEYYILLYPDPAWVPCALDCKLCGGKPLERPLVESHYRFATASEAIQLAERDGHTVVAI